MEKLKSIWADIKKSLGKKVLIGLVGYVVVYLQGKFPDMQLPSADLVKDLVAALLVTHTLTDIVALLKTGGKEWLAEMVQKN